MSKHPDLGDLRVIVRLGDFARNKLVQQIEEIERQTSVLYYKEVMVESDGMSCIDEKNPDEDSIGLLEDVGMLHAILYV